jgi:Tol biopolymer transport system component
MNTAFRTYSILFIGIFLVCGIIPARTEPVNEKIAFVTNRDGNDEIYIMNADGSDQRRITRNSYRDSQPKWSPDGKKIAFVSDRDGDDEIYIMNTNGWFQRRITRNEFSDWDPSWSPDGKKIAFVSDRDDLLLEIYVMNADGSDVRRLTDNSSFDTCPAWSPDGEKIAFSRGDGIYVMNPDGSDQLNISNNSTLDISPSWSPDGTKIAFSSDRYVYWPSSTFYLNRRNWIHRWSPSGTRIAYFTTEEILDIFVMNADGSDQRELTNKFRDIGEIIVSNNRGPSWGSVQAPLPGSSEDGIGSYSIFLIIIIVTPTILFLAFRKNMLSKKSNSTFQ